MAHRRRHIATPLTSREFPVNDLDRTIRSLREQADAFTALEQRLILLTGQFLLQDEQVGPP